MKWKLIRKFGKDVYRRKFDTLEDVIIWQKENLTLLYEQYAGDKSRYTMECEVSYAVIPVCEDCGREMNIAEDTDACRRCGSVK